MNDLDESKAVVQIVDRLHGRFPEVEVAHIEDMVVDLRAQYVGAPVRDYFPVLIEHQAKKRIHSERSSIGQLRLV